jgi:nucleoside-diphosphate-sugar epimerase
MKYFVTGGSGFVGRHLLLRLLTDGHDVRALARSEESAAVVEALGATAVRADLVDVHDVIEDLRGAGVVVHAAAETQQGGRPADFDRVNVTGTRRLLEAARQVGVPRFVHVSTEAVLADGNPVRFVDESAPYPKRHAGDYARTKALAEQLVLAADSREMATVAVRPRLVWGPGDTTILPQILQAVEGGRWAWVSGGHYLTSTCHVLNLCEGIQVAAARGAGGRAYFVTDGAPVEFRSFITRCAAEHGVTMPERTVSYTVARTAAAVLDKGWRVLPLKGEPPVSSAAMALGGHEVTVNDVRARLELGYVPVISVDEGIAELAASSREQS